MTPKQFTDWLSSICDLIDENPTPEQWGKIKAKLDEIPKKRVKTKKAPSHEVLEVINFLNLKASKNYQPDSVNAQLISTRLNEGATVDQCKQVIVLMCRQWLNDPKMNRLLRPATLFNHANFSQYVGQLVVREVK